MSTNDQIILDQVLQQRKEAVAPLMSAADFFEMFVAEQLLKKYDLSYEETESGIVGQGGDGGIDGIYTFVNGDLVQEDTDVSNLKKNILIELVIFQAKQTSGFGEEAIHKLMVVFEDLFNLSNDLSTFIGVYNAELLANVAKFRKVYTGLASHFPEVAFSFAYATRGIEIHPNVQRKADILKEKVRLMYSAANVDFEFLSAQRLLTLARRAPKTTYRLSLAETPISSAGDIGFICLVKLRDYSNFITDENGQLRRYLFEANVRDYQGSTQVNEEIQNSLRDSGKEDFWWLNNGITILADQAREGGKVVDMEAPQIVNGLQTSTEIYNYFAKNPQVNDSRNLLVRVIVPSFAESNDRVIKATNSQTAIPAASLRATDKIHRDVEEYLKPYGLYYDRRKNLYKNEGKPLSQIVSIPLMAQAVMAIVLQRPDSARARPSSLLKATEDYNKVFDPTYPIDIYRRCIKFLRKIEAGLIASHAMNLKDRNNLRFYVAMYAVCLSVNKAHPTVRELCSFTEENLTDEVIMVSIEQVIDEYNNLGGTDQVAKGTHLRANLLMKLELLFSRHR
ncbi:MAG: AIPR family protein [Janthinobacterium lividum]